MTEHMKYEMQELYVKPCLMFNCGVMMDYMGYTPRTLEEILEADRKNVKTAAGGEAEGAP